MRSKRVNSVGRFAVDFEVANFGDLELARRQRLVPRDPSGPVYEIE